MSLVGTVLKGFIRHGRLRVRHPDGTTEEYVGDAPGPQAGIWLKTQAAAMAFLINPALRLPERYMDGAIQPMDCTLFELMDVLMLNAERSPHPTAWLASGTRTLKRSWSQLNLTHRAQKNAAHHYDLNGRLYSLFLDRDQQYSCAYFRRGDETLEEAQEAKKHHIAAKLKLDRPGLRVLDIGCGWGGMALTLARDYGAQVTGITLSREQLAGARQRVRREGLEDRVRFLLLDYRAVRERFDRIVSVGMFEHVGVLHYRRFFEALRNGLTEDGIALLHAIGRSDGPGSTNAWIDRYIFPGGYAPALSETLAAIERSGLWVTDIEILRLHYARTIELWRRRFAANRDVITSLYDARFYRMFEMYLVGAELAFRRQGQMNFQIQLTRSPVAAPLTRDYMQAAEAARGRTAEVARAGTAAACQQMCDRNTSPA